MKDIFTINELKNFAYIITGTLVLALGVVLFFLSNSITTGGTPGMALLIHHLSGVSIGIVVIAINIPLLLWGIKYLGKMFAVRTIISIVLMSFFIDLFSQFLHLDAITNDILLASIFGGVFIGIGVGLILRGDSSAGGPTIVARIVSARTELKPGQIILFIDFFIILSSIYVFNDIDKTLWSILSIYVTSKCIDVMLSGAPTTKVVHITSGKALELSTTISQQLGKEGTILKGSGLSSQIDKEIIFIVVELRNLRRLREIISENDPEAFMIVMDASEMIGRGH